jgi:hypothetical protein
VKIEVAKRALALGLVDLLRRHFPGQSIASFIEIIIGITLLRAFIQGVWLHAQGR